MLLDLSIHWATFPNVQPAIKHAAAPAFTYCRYGYIIITRVACQPRAGMQHRLLLSCFTHAKEALETEGHNAKLTTSPATQRIAVCTTRQCIHLYRPQPSSKASMLPPSLQHLMPAINPADLVLTHSINISESGIPSAIASGACLGLLPPAAPPRLQRLCCADAQNIHAPTRRVGADTHGITIALLSGDSLQLTWTGHVRAAPGLCPPDTPGRSASSMDSATAAHITQIVAQPDCLDAALVYSDGSAAQCICDANAQSPLMHAVHARWLVEPGGGALCGAIGVRAQSIALGCADGVTRMWAATGAADAEARELSLGDWGHGVESTGAVACVMWTPDGEVRFTPPPASARCVAHAAASLAVQPPDGSGCDRQSRPPPACHPVVTCAGAGGGV